MGRPAGFAKDTYIAAFTMAAIAVHLVLRFALGAAPDLARLPLILTLVLGGGPLVWDLTRKVARREFGADLLAGISIITAVLLEQYLAGSLVVLMLSGGTSLEQYAVRSASSVLEALAKRVPSVAHRKEGATVTDIALDAIAVEDLILVYPHEICPVDGVVVDGHGVMDESYLTGEPFVMSKTPGSAVLSGAVNGEYALTIRATKLAVDSRYATIMKVMRASEQRRPSLRRLGDQLGAIYTPVAIAVAIAAWLISGEAVRFLAVLVIATPCPLLIAIPVAVIGSISLAAKRGIIIKDPAVLEQIDTCRTIIFDKTGTLTYGEPELTEQLGTAAADPDTARVLQLAASLERYSKHPLAGAIIAAARAAGLDLIEAAEIGERPFEGLRGTVAGRSVRITNRKWLAAERPGEAAKLPPVAGGLECAVLVDDRYAATYRFRDTPRVESTSFVSHLGPKHLLDKTILLSGDRESEVRYLAEEVGITELHAGKSPEEKVEIVRAETAKAKTIFVGDGINDAPALMAATVGLAFGQESEITTEAAGAVIMDSSLTRVDEFFHISRRMRRIALQSAVGGMALSVAGMLVAAAGYLTPVGGAIAQEVIDLAAVLNALRVAMPPKDLTDF